jgi:hypothetical protein
MYNVFHCGCQCGRRDTSHQRPSPHARVPAYPGQSGNCDSGVTVLAPIVDLPKNHEGSTAIVAPGNSESEAR